MDLCEQSGVDSIWQSDRLVSRVPILESLTAMAAIAGRTRRIKFGMNVIALALRERVAPPSNVRRSMRCPGDAFFPVSPIGSPRGAEWTA